MPSDKQREVRNPEIRNPDQSGSSSSSSGADFSRKQFERGKSQEYKKLVLLIKIWQSKTRSRGLLALARLHWALTIPTP